MENLREQDRQIARERKSGKTEKLLVKTFFILIASAEQIDCKNDKLSGQNNLNFSSFRWVFCMLFLSHAFSHTMMMTLEIEIYEEERARSGTPADNEFRKCSFLNVISRFWSTNRKFCQMENFCSSVSVFPFFIAMIESRDGGEAKLISVVESTSYLRK